jgi:outer membrane murein-binding lipoprotein Lpp
MAIYEQEKRRDEWEYASGRRNPQGGYSRVHSNSARASSRRVPPGEKRRQALEDFEAYYEEVPIRDNPRLKEAREKARERVLKNRGAKQAARLRMEKKLRARKKMRMIVAAVILGGVLLGTISLEAYKTSLQSHIARTNAQIRVAEDEIAEMNLRFEMEFNSRRLFEKAQALGMIVPGEDQLIYIGDAAKISQLPEHSDFAQYIRENAYELW